MIQIQDDFVNQSQPAAPIQATDNSTPPMVVSDTVPDQNEQINQAVQATMQKVEDNTKNNAAEIDRLLAELDELSKNLESQAVAPNEVKSEPVESPIVEPLVVESPATEPSTVQPLVSTIDVPNKVETSPSEEEEKFDFDAFLDDLEKKIDEESAKIKAAKAENPQGDSVVPPDPAPTTPSLEESTLVSDSTDDFRKNRAPSQNLVEDQEAATEAILAPEPAEEKSSENSDESEELRAQNIFEMLGLAKISDEEKNQFLDELESMIWDDFVVHDLELLLTSEEYVKVREILDSASDENQKKEDLIVYLEKIIPDLDEVLYEKALELKSEMMGERLSKMKEGADEATLAKVKQAEGLISRNLWRQAANLLNS